MRLLLEAGAAVDMFDNEGMTPLAVAVENESLAAVELLLQYGADVNAAVAAGGGGNGETGSVGDGGMVTGGDWEDKMEGEERYRDWNEDLEHYAGGRASGSRSETASGLL
jgi:ankyrin repeat protein